MDPSVNCEVRKSTFFFKIIIDVGTSVIYKNFRENKSFMYVGTF